MTNLVHVLVGSGLPIYFRNALVSLLDNSSNDVIAIYNSISASDQPNIDDILLGNSERLTLRVVQNERSRHTKTGSLYNAYNWALDSCSEKYDLVHFMQGDMQLMSWPGEIENQIGKIFEDGEENYAPDCKLLCLAIYAPPKSFGLRWFETNLEIEPSEKTYLYSSRAMVDSGIYSVPVMREMGFHFQGSEDDVNYSLYRSGYRLRLLQSPLTAFIPWPAVIRNGRIRGREPAHDGQGRDQPLLQLNNFSEMSHLEREKGSMFTWAEDWVIPSGWACPSPYILTDLFRFQQVVSRRKLCKQLGVSFWSVVGSRTTDRFRDFLRPGIYPYGAFEFLIRVLLLLFKEPYMYFKDIIKLGIPRFGGRVPVCLVNFLPHKMRQQIIRSKWN